MRRVWRLGILALGCLGTPGVALGVDDATEGATALAASTVDPRTEQARDLYRAGVEHTRRAEWAEALAAFEQSASLRPHATTTFNIGACERALGHYTRATGTFERALAAGVAEPGSLAPSLVTEAQAMLAQIRSVLARLEVYLEPAHASILIDGRPLTSSDRSPGVPVLVAGVEPPGPGKAPPASRFDVVLNPGAHVITLSRQGYADAVVRRSLLPGSKQRLDLKLERLPASLNVSANVENALVRVSGADVGPVPVEVLRPAGSYQVVVTRAGYDPYETSVTVRAGEQSQLRATLSPESRPVTKEWWFWTGAIAIVATGAAVTYALTRPEPQPPAYNGGSTGWVVQPSAFSF